VSIHVLVADDEPHIGRIIQTKLEQGPFRVTLVADGPGAVKALEEYPDIALVLLDLMMPGLTGMEVLARMRADARWKSLPCDPHRGWTRTAARRGARAGRRRVHDEALQSEAALRSRRGVDLRVAGRRIARQTSCR
jgi:DNA-binding NarL/FixJ family response regulator